MRVTACVGDYAEKPYNVPGVDLVVYSMEELCFCLKENAFLLDAALMNDGLVKWIDKQCGLRSLADELASQIRHKMSLSVFVITILQYVGLYDGHTMREIEQLLKLGAGLSQIEKKKKQTDYLLHGKKYIPAMKGYQEIIALWGEKETSGEALPAVNCLADVWHNLGVAEAGVMNLSRAAECFLKAYTLTQSKTEALCYGAAMKLSLPKQEYEVFLQEQGYLYYEEFELNQQLHGLLQAFEQTPEAMLLSRSQELLDSGDTDTFAEETNRIIGRMKESYRSGILPIDL